MNIAEAHENLARLQDVLSVYEEYIERDGDLAWSLFYALAADWNLELKYAYPGQFVWYRWQRRPRIELPRLYAKSADTLFELFDLVFDRDVLAFWVDAEEYILSVNLLGPEHKTDALVTIRAPMLAEDLCLLEALGKVHRESRTTHDVTVYCA